MVVLALAKARNGMNEPSTVGFASSGVRNKTQNPIKSSLTGRSSSSEMKQTQENQLETEIESVNHQPAAPSLPEPK